MSNNHDGEVDISKLVDRKPESLTPEEIEALKKFVEQVSDTFQRVAMEMQQMIQLIAQGIAISLEPLRDLIETHTPKNTEKENQNDS